MGAVHVLAGEEDQLDGIGDLHGPRVASLGEGREQPGRIVALPVRAGTVALDHELASTLGGDGGPDGDAVLMHRDRDLGGLRTELAEARGAGAYLRIDSRLALGPAEAFLDHRDLEALGTLA